MLLGQGGIVIQLHKDTLWKVDYDLFKAGDCLGTLFFDVGINVTIDRDVATIEPTTTGSKVYCAGVVVSLTAFDQVMWRHTIISPKELHKVRTTGVSFDRLDLDPWEDRGAIEDHLRDYLRRFGIDIKNRQPRGRKTVSMVDIMRFIRIAPHHLALASTLNYEMKRVIWLGAPHDISSWFWDGMGKSSLCALASWRVDHPNNYRLLLAALSGIRVIRCSWDREAGP